MILSVKKQINLLNKLGLFFILLTASACVSFLPSTASAYPDFISYGYSSCITCHYNGLGGGALNDYGRALFATEITARDIYPSTIEDEEIGAQSGFLGSKQMPWWIRPGLKYRGLWYQTNPGSQHSVDNFINMQQDVNINLFADKKQNLALITTYTYIDKLAPEAKYTSWKWYIKESFLRWKWSNNLWIYLGQMDKAFGVRNIDHTGSNRVFRSNLGGSILGQSDQSVGAIIHLTYPNWDLATNIFTGNIDEKEFEKQKGISIVGEYQVDEKVKIGSSLLQSENDITRWKLFALTARTSLTKGSSIIAEIGLKENTDKTNGTSQLGDYLWIESIISLRRGYNLVSVIESNKRDINSISVENMKLSLGTMIFPLPRTELRFMAVNNKNYEVGIGHSEAWSVQSQVHVSY